MPRPIKPEDLFKLKFLHSVAVSPDGAQVVYALSEYDAESDVDFSNLWLLDIETGTTQQLTQGIGNNTEPAWSPDGCTLAFLSDRSGATQIFLLPLHGGEARQLTAMSQGVGGAPAWSPEGSWLAFSATKPSANEPVVGEPYRVTRTIYRFDAMNYLDATVHDLYAVDVENGTIVQLTDDDNHNGDPKWSPNGSRLLFTVAMKPEASVAYYPDLATVDVSDLGKANFAGEAHTIVDGGWGEPSNMAAWLPDSNRIAFVGQTAGKPIGSKSDLFVVDIDGGRPQNRTANHAIGMGGRMQPDMPCAAFFAADELIIAADGKTAYADVQAGGTIQVWRVALAGEERHEVVLDGDRTVLPLALDAGSTHLYTLVSSMTDPLDIHLADLSTGVEQRLTDVNAAMRAEVVQPGVEPMRFTSIDGIEVEGWMMLPHADSPVPTVLYIHGGPHSAFGHLYHFDTQMLVGAGYGVLMVNHRASTGYGDAFSTAIKGDWGNLDYADLMAGVDEAIALGWADPARLGVCGLSGGGNLSAWIVGQTNRFKAAVPENPVTNWLSFYGVSDIGVWFSVEQLGGHPHEVPEAYVKCSPITFAHRCTTPTLLVQCESDWRCPAEQSEQFYAALKASGCTVEMVRLPGGSHDSSIKGPPKLRRAQNEALLDWMERHVRG